jgi:hypothetical protein
MIVAEVVKTFLELDQASEVFFTFRTDTGFVYVIASLPDGQRVAAELPTGIPKTNSEEKQ